MFEADATISPILLDDDDTLSPWDDVIETPVPIEPDEEEDLIIPKPIAPLEEEEEEEQEDDELGILPEELDDEL